MVIPHVAVVRLSVCVGSGSGYAGSRKSPRMEGCVVSGCRLCSLDKQLGAGLAQGHIENPLVASGVFRT